MKLIERGKAGGKTTEAIRIANETGAYLVVADRNRATRAQEMGAKRFPITFDELLDRRYSAAFVRNIVIDDVDDLIHYIARRAGLYKVEAVTGDFLTEDGRERR